MMKTRASAAEKRAGFKAATRSPRARRSPAGSKPAASVLPFAPAPRQTLQDHVYKAIKELILTGDISPGQSITINSLASAFAVSHMPVREALHRLVAERALTVISGRSVGLPPLSIARLEDLKRIRLEMEGLATSWACSRLSDRDLDRLDELVQSMARADRNSDVKAFLHGNRDFHFGIYRSAGSQTLLSIIESLWVQISPYFNLLHASGNYARANREHKNLAAALKRRDARSARAAIVADINGAAAVLREILSA
ncbi:MAG: GntR family transcriptional regulator [Hyphomicrobiales bacterium]